MVNRIARKLVFGAALIAMVTPAALAAPLGTDPPPGIVHIIMALLGLE